MMGSKEYEKLWGMIKPLKFGMLCTMDQGSLRSRPMSLVQEKFEGSIYFFTDDNTHKVEEIKARHSVNISFSSPKEQIYISLSGEAEMTRDKTLIDKFWSPAVEAYFPKGKTDPHLTLMEIKINCAESWDATESKMARMFELAKANVRGTPPDLGEHRSYQ